jgi:hypothetical protein
MARVDADWFGNGPLYPNALPSDNLGDGSLGGGFDFSQWLQQQLAEQARQANATVGSASGGLGGTTVPHGTGPAVDPYQREVRAPSGYGQNAPGNPGDEIVRTPPPSQGPLFGGGGSLGGTTVRSGTGPWADPYAGPITWPGSTSYPTGLPQPAAPAAPAPAGPSILPQARGVAVPPDTGMPVVATTPVTPRAGGRIAAPTTAAPTRAAPRATTGARSPFNTFQYQVPGSGYRVAGANHGPLGGNAPIYTALDLSRLFGRA